MRQFRDLMKRLLRCKEVVGRVMEADGLAPVYELAETEERGGDAHSLSITIVVAAQAFPVF
jgi:hypothetical protein